ncbi:MAG: tetratricopeptide repeat protein [Rhodopila sp.]
MDQEAGGKLVYYQSSNLNVYGVQPFGGERVVITFGSYLTPGDDGRGFAEAFLYKYRIDAIHVVPRSNSWFQYPDISAALAVVVAQTAGYARRIAYGSSMGGYAAINFSDHLEVDRVIAISPQFSIDPAKMPDDPRWRHAAERIRFIRDNIAGLEKRGARQIYAIYDNRHELDAQQVARIAQSVDMIAVPAPFAGHPAGGMLVEAGLLSGMVRQLIDDAFDVEVFAAEYAAAAPQTAAYNASLATVLPANRLEDRLRAARRAVAMQPASPVYRHLLSHLLGEAGAHEEAVAILRELAERNNAIPELHHALALALERAGRLAEAVAASRAGLALAPDSPTLWALLGRLLDDAGEGDEAEDCLRRAIGLAPGTAATAFRLSRLLAHQGRQHEALSLAIAAVNNAPDRAHYHAHIARLYLAVRNWREAEAGFERAVRLDPRTALFLRLGIIRLRQGRAAAALDAARLALLTLLGSRRHQ